MRSSGAAVVMPCVLLAACGAPPPKAAEKPVVACAGVDRRLDAPMQAFDEQSIGAHLFRDPALIHVDRMMRQDHWMIAWSAPAGIGSSVYVLRHNGPIWEVVGEGRTAEAHTRAQVAGWAMGLERHRPTPMPPTLAWCLADALVGPAASSESRVGS